MQDPSLLAQRWLECSVQHVFPIGQFVRMKGRTGGLCEVVRILPVLDHGVALYIIRNEQGAEVIVRHHEIGKA